MTLYSSTWRSREHVTAIDIPVVDDERLTDLRTLLAAIPEAQGLVVDIVTVPRPGSGKTEQVYWIRDSQEISFLDRDFYRPSDYLVGSQSRAGLKRTRWERWHQDSLMEAYDPVVPVGVR